MPYGFPPSSRLRHAVLAFGLLALPGLNAWADSETPAPSSRETPPNSRYPVSFNAHWDSDAINNLHGGIKNGTVFDSTAQAGVTINGDRAGLPGTTLHAALFAIRSGNASDRLVGDTLGVSNIEGTRNRLVLADAYWIQQWRPWLSTQVGVFDLNSLFDYTDSANQLLNGGFGPDPGMTANFTASTFPRNGSGAVMTLEQGAWMLQGGILQGRVAQQEHPFDQGVLDILEGSWSRPDGQAVKLGLWRRRGAGFSNMRGLYLSAEQPLAATGRLVGFARAGLSRADQTDALTLRHYFSAGFNWQGVLPQRPEDHLTGAVTRARLDTADGPGHEQVAELAYVVRLNRHLYLQPDLQYINRPSGIWPAAWVATLRLHIE